MPSGCLSLRCCPLCPVGPSRWRPCLPPTHPASQLSRLRPSQDLQPLVARLMGHLGTEPSPLASCPKVQPPGPSRGPFLRWTVPGPARLQPGFRSLPQAPGGRSLMVPKKTREMAQAAGGGGVREPSPLPLITGLSPALARPRGDCGSGGSRGRGPQAGCLSPPRDFSVEVTVLPRSWQSWTVTCLWRVPREDRLHQLSLRQGGLWWHVAVSGVSVPCTSSRSLVMGSWSTQCPPWSQPREQIRPGHGPRPPPRGPVCARPAPPLASWRHALALRDAPGLLACCFFLLVAIRCRVPRCPVQVSLPG